MRIFTWSEDSKANPPFVHISCLRFGNEQHASGLKVFCYLEADVRHQEEEVGSDRFVWVSYVRIPIEST